MTGALKVTLASIAIFFIVAIVGSLIALIAVAVWGLLLDRPSDATVGFARLNAAGGALEELLRAGLYVTVLKSTATRTLFIGMLALIWSLVESAGLPMNYGNGISINFTKASVSFFPVKLCMHFLLLFCSFNFFAKGRWFLLLIVCIVHGAYNYFVSAFGASFIVLGSTFLALSILAFLARPKEYMAPKDSLGAGATAKR